MEESTSNASGGDDGHPDGEVAPDWILSRCSFDLNGLLGMATWNTKALFASMRGSAKAKAKMKVVQALAARYHILVLQETHDCMHDLAFPSWDLP